MAWEPRLGGRRYFYKSTRVDGVPRKIYLGSGQAAEAEAKLIDEARQLRQTDLEAKLSEQERLQPADAILDALRDLTDLVASALLIQGGYHEHRGQWRKWRQESSPRA